MRHALFGFRGVGLFDRRDLCFRLHQLWLGW